MKRFIFLLLLLGCLDAYSQKAAIRVNALSAIDGAFGGNFVCHRKKEYSRAYRKPATVETERRICQPLLAPAARI